MSDLEWLDKYWLRYFKKERVSDFVYREKNAFDSEFHSLKEIIRKGEK